MAEFEINVQDLDEGGKDYDFPISRAWLSVALTDTDIEPALEEGGWLRFHAHMQGRDVVVNGRVRAGLVAECARCLADTPVEVETRFSSLLVARSADLRPEPDEVELTPEDLEREFYSGDVIALDDAVRETLLLEIPMQLLCSEECPGIAVPEEIAGPADLREAEKVSGVDPRLAPLLKLVGQVEPAEES